MTRDLPIQWRPRSAPANATLDRTAKLYVGGRQVRPDGGV